MRLDQEPEQTGENPSVETIGRGVRRGLSWSLTASLATKIGSFAMGLVLARLLAPADFGLYAIALAATGFVMHVNDVGLIAATVQWRGRLRDVAPTASTLAAIFSFTIYAAFYIGAPAFAELAGNPEAAPVVRLLTLVIVVDGITAVRVAALQRHFMQHRIALANMAGFAVQAPVAIALAADGAGAYTFAWAQLAQAVVTGLVVFVWARIPVQLGFDPAVARRLLRYGVPLAASLGVEALLMNADFIIVGRIMGATALGFYLLAFNVSSWVANAIGTAVRYVSVAGFSRLAEHDGALSQGVQRAMPALLAGVLPVAVLMGLLSQPLVSFLYGDRWTPAAPVLTLLMALAVVRLLAGLALDVLMGSGATRSALFVNIGWAAALVPALVVGTQLDGIRGAAWAHVIVGIVVALPLSGIALRRVGVRFGPMVPAVVRPLLAAALTAVVATLTAEWLAGPAVVELVVVGTVGLLCYVGSAFPLGHLRDRGSAALRGLRRRTT